MGTRTAPVEKPKPGSIKVYKPPVKPKINPNSPKFFKENPKVVAQKKTNDVNKYLTNDTTYQAQLAAINQSLSDYQAQNLNAQNQYQTQYTQNEYDLGRSNDQNRRDVMDDYAGRGMVRSGLYGVAEGKRSDEAASSQSNLDIARGTYMGDLNTNLSNFSAQQNLAKQQARQDAIKRRALGLLQNG